MWLRSNVADVILCSKQYIKYSINTPLRLLLPARAARLDELAEQHSSSVQSCQPLVCHSLLNVFVQKPNSELLRIVSELKWQFHKNQTKPDNVISLYRKFPCNIPRGSTISMYNLMKLKPGIKTFQEKQTLFCLVLSGSDRANNMYSLLQITCQLTNGNSVTIYSHGHERVPIVVYTYSTYVNAAAVTQQVHTQ